MKIRAGNHDVLDTGLVIAYKDEPVIFEVAPGAPPLLVELIFAKSDDPGQRMDAKIPEAKHLVITLFNFDNVLGTGTVDPMQVGTLNGRKLYLNLRVYMLNESASRTIHYTWYLGEAANG